ncbi:methyltransferase domain-containing protein [Thermomonospora umbrina]|uniref:Protein-L-isoaspartate O-methyltransferase n=1 Tax=Thermomonospora umbrina TaxID=111806 RepID=A0A3D9SYX8_9ACTN|nr:methyltransferase domain-containing protein [Thermomonospora umbrina]REE97774.1 protein-L-isoaspartate(D-aspartate) O-methyltransferase [Thermomonospora umbrina]
MTPEEAIKAVPRHPFIPDRIFVRNENNHLVPCERREDPERWREAVDSEGPVVTRAAFDTAIPPEYRNAATGAGVEATSSNSAPHIVRRMLEALDLEPGMAVLEIGSGTGWNAALLATIAGVSNVTTVEIDPELAALARTNLERAGCPVEVITGDGELGHPRNAPYDRVICTAAVSNLPYVWVEQTRPGGIILAPWGPIHPDWPLCHLVVTDEGTADGRFIAPSWFMPLRDQRPSRAAARQAEKLWKTLGEPTIDRFGITVSPEGQRIWLDLPDNPIDKAWSSVR